MRREADVPTFKREVALALALVAAGLLILPFAVYVVGTQVFGDYGPDLGLLDLLLHIWSDVGRGSPLALLLVTGPYLIALLLRLAWKLWQGGSVKSVTDPHDEH